MDSSNGPPDPSASLLGPESRLSSTPSPTMSAQRPRTPRPYPPHSMSRFSLSPEEGTEADDEMPRKLPAPTRKSIKEKLAEDEFYGNKTRLGIELALIVSLVGGVLLVRCDQVDWRWEEGLGKYVARWAGLIVSGWVYGAWRRQWKGGQSGDFAEWVYPCIIPVVMAGQLSSEIIPGNLVLSAGSVPVDWDWIVGMLVTPRWEEGCWMWSLQKQLCDGLHGLVTPSLSRTEIRLMSIGLVDLLWYGRKPHMVVLKAVLWIGGLGIWLLNEDVLRWGVQIARVPRHRFKRAANTVRAANKLGAGAAAGNVGSSTEEEEEREKDFVTFKIGGAGEKKIPIQIPLLTQSESAVQNTTKPRRQSSLTSSSTSYWRGFSYQEAQTRRYIYAGITYLTILALFFFGIAPYISAKAFANHPLYFFLPSYILCGQPLYASFLSYLIPSPTISQYSDCTFLLSTPSLGPATPAAAQTRLYILFYWALILTTGLTTNLLLKPYIQLDTRRKIFHFTIVAILLPTIHLDPPFTALVLSLLLPVFLLSDLLRATTLPPLSKPIATFLAPFVDGRDLKGPIVVSHVFLLLGCAVPVWLTLARDAGEPHSLRELASGTVCVGIGDAMASLLGRRFGHLGRRWGWGGGKTLIGSLGFVGGVFVGLVLAAPRERLGLGVAVKLLGIAGMGGLWEAVVKGGNDNLVVPGVVWVAVGGAGV